jgi:hypothetical protein
MIGKTASSETPASDGLGWMADPGHPEHEQYLTGCGGQFDPATFDLFAANQRLSDIKL